MSNKKSTKKNAVLPRLIYVVYSSNNNRPEEEITITAFGDKKQAAEYCDWWNKDPKVSKNVTLFFNPLNFQE